MAWYYKQFQDVQSAAERMAYAAAECTAMRSKIGLWTDPRPVPATAKIEEELLLGWAEVLRSVRSICFRTVWHAHRQAA